MADLGWEEVWVVDLSRTRADETAIASEDAWFSVTPTEQLQVYFLSCVSCEIASESAAQAETNLE